MQHKFFLILLGVGACGALGWALADNDSPRPVRYTFVLSPDEIGLARDLAEKDMLDAAGQKIVFVKVELMPESQAESSQRTVMVQHYRYATDETIFTLVDLQKEEVVQREFATRYPTALTSDEIQRAIGLARADDRLPFYLEGRPTEFDTRPIQISDIQNPLFGHRVVHVLLRQAGNYLVRPQILVDLTTETVHLDTIPRSVSE